VCLTPEDEASTRGGVDDAVGRAEHARWLRSRGSRPGVREVGDVGADDDPVHFATVRYRRPDDDGEVDPVCRRGFHERSAVPLPTPRLGGGYSGMEGSWWWEQVDVLNRQGPPEAHGPRHGDVPPRRVEIGCTRSGRRQLWRNGGLRSGKSFDEPDPDANGDEHGGREDGEGLHENQRRTQNECQVLRASSAGQRFDNGCLHW